VSVALTSSGSVQGVQLYDPYGSVRYSSGTLPTSYGFTRQRLDGSGLNYFHARYYDSGVGQFTSADSVQGPNRYGYVGGNPETRTDPSGNCFIVCAIVGAVAGAVVGTVAAVSAIQQGEPVGNAIAHAAVDVALGAAAGAVITTPGAVVGLITSVAGVALSAATGGVNLRSPAGIQSAFESIAIGTLVGAASGALGNSLATGLSGFERGTSAFYAAAGRAASTYTIMNAGINIGATLLQGGINMIDGKPSTVTPSKLLISGLIGLGGGFLGGGYGFYFSNPTAITNAGVAITGIGNAIYTAASDYADRRSYGSRYGEPDSTRQTAGYENGDEGGGIPSVYNHSGVYTY
jgi:RHS repeat-associated protein